MRLFKATFDTTTVIVFENSRDEAINSLKETNDSFFTDLDGLHFLWDDGYAEKVTLVEVKGKGVVFWREH